MTGGLSSDDLARIRLMERTGRIIPRPEDATAPPPVERAPADEGRRCARPGCGLLLVPRATERAWQFRERLYCDRSCAAQARTRQAWA